MSNDRTSYHLVIYKTKKANEFLVFSDLKDNVQLKFVELTSSPGKYLENITDITIKSKNYLIEKSQSLSKENQINSFSAIRTNCADCNLDEVVVYGYIPSKPNYVPYFNLGWIFNSIYNNSFLNFEVASDPGYGGNGGENNQDDSNNENNLPDKTPCPEMKKISTNQKIIDSLSYLATITDKDHEEGFVLTKNSVGEYGYTKITGKKGVPNIQFNMNTDTYGLIHSHYDGLNFMPSLEDLLQFGRIVKGYSANNRVDMAMEFTLGVVSSYGTFIVKINDIDKFLLFTLQKLEDSTAFSNLSDAYSGKPFYMTDPSKQDEWENSFAKFISAYQTGLIIYRSTDDHKKWLPLLPNVFEKNVNYGKTCK